MKDEYSSAIKELGSKEVKIIDETSFSIECVVNDPTAKAIMKNLRMSPEKLKGTASSVRSIKVSGIKPARAMTL